MHRLNVYTQHFRVPKLTKLKVSFRRFSTEEKHEESNTSEKSESKLLWGTGFVGIFVWFQLCIAGLGWSRGTSMEPTLMGGDISLVVRKQARKDLQIGDVVELKHPVRMKTLIYKRVRALETDVVVNWDGKTVRVPAGHIWVEGDNTDTSLDSRQWGPLPINLVNGKVYPFSRVQKIEKDPNYFEKNPQGHSYLFGTTSWEKMVLEMAKNNAPAPETEKEEKKS